MPYGSRSARTAPLPDDWEPSIRPRILARDGGACQWPAVEGICGRPARNVDHKLAAHLGGTDDDDNLWSLCDLHERAKTGAEGGKAWHAKRKPRQRPTEQHPGLLT